MADLMMTIRWDDEDGEAAIVQRKELLRQITGDSTKDLTLLDFLADAKFETDKLYRDALMERDRKTAPAKVPANE